MEKQPTTMTAEEFIALQDRLQWDNAKLAKKLRLTPQSISNYRTGRQKVTGPVKVLLESFEAEASQNQ